MIATADCFGCIRYAANAGLQNFDCVRLSAMDWAGANSTQVIPDLIAKLFQSLPSLIVGQFVLAVQDRTVGGDEVVGYFRVRAVRKFLPKRKNDRGNRGGALLVQQLCPLSYCCSGFF